MSDRSDPLPPELDGTPTRTGGVGGAIESEITTRLKLLAASAASTSVTDATPTPYLPQLPAKYEVRRWLGAGGMGEVYLAFDTKLKRLVAVKVMRGHVETSHKGRARFQSEAAVLAQMKHRNVVEVFEWDDSGEQPFFVMAYLDGKTLHERREEFRSSAAQAVWVLREITRGVQHAHEQGILHRDLKGSNVMFDGDTPVVTDFGCAKWEEATTKTEGYALFGTYSHMAPEVLEYGSSKHDARSDLWSIGVMLYHLLAGELPFPDDPRIQPGRNKVLHDDPLPIRGQAGAVPGVDDRLEAVVRKALAKNPAERYQSAAEFAADLERWRTGEEAGPRPTRESIRQKPTRRQWWVMAGAGLVLGCGAATTVALWPRREAKRELADQLAAGEEVVLIGMKGLPVEDCRRVESFPEGSLDRRWDGYCSVSASRIAMFELGALDVPFAVTLSAEVSHITENPGSRVGIYAFRKGHRQSGVAGVNHAALVNWFSGSAIQPGTNGEAALSAYWFAPLDPSPQFVTPAKAPRSLAISRQKAQAREGDPEFRRLTLLLDPLAMTGSHGELGFGRPFATADVSGVFRRLAADRDETLTGAAFPGTGFGLVVQQGVMAVRSVTLART